VLFWGAGAPFRMPKAPLLLPLLNNDSVIPNPEKSG
jgi:hypothetical protein